LKSSRGGFADFFSHEGFTAENEAPILDAGCAMLVAGKTKFRIKNLELRIKKKDGGERTPAYCLQGQAGPKQIR
jgi:hypothetical protein